jgi:hypothetical protein
VLRRFEELRDQADQIMSRAERILREQRERD